MSGTDAAAHMRRALELAQRGWGQVQPNPLVGAVVVQDDAIVGEGFHTRYGAAHAEVEALRAAGDAARGATLFVTLEPCAHHGRTPPCTEAIIAAGVSTVVFAAEDPNPVAAGGAARLAAAGIRVIGGVERLAARALNAAFFHVQECGAPFVALKLAVSLDGRISAGRGQRTHLTGAAGLRGVHRLRSGFDAILVGSGTARTDDPLLTVRGVPSRTPPVRVVLDSHARLSPESRLARTTDQAPLWIVTARAADGDAVAALGRAGAHVLSVDADGGGRVDVRAALRALAAAGVRTVLVEGGAEVATALLHADLVHRLHLLVAPTFLGAEGVPAFELTTPPAVAWEPVAVERMEADVMLTWDRNRNS